MASTKLTITTRDQIERAVLYQCFKGREEALEAREHEIGDAAYNEIFGAKDRERMLSLPRGWLPECGSFRVQISGRTVSLPLATPRRFPDNKSHGVLAVFEANHKVSRRWQTFENAKTDLKDGRKKLRSEVRAVLYSVNTTKQLLEVWPEIAPFLRDADKPPQTLPSLRIEELNTALGLTKAA